MYRIYRFHRVCRVYRFYRVCRVYRVHRVWRIEDDEHRRVAAFKPANGERFVSRGISPGAGSLREQAVYLFIDRLTGRQAAVPTTARRECRRQKKQSFQVKATCSWQAAKEKQAKGLCRVMGFM